jgi:hypothetical protein
MFFKKKKEKDEFDFDDKLGDPLSDNSNDKNEGLTNNDADLGLSSAVKDSSSNNSFDSLHQSGMHDNNNNNTNNNSNNMNQNNQGSITNNSNNEFQIMNAKLDSIKSELDALRQHVLKIEEVINKSKKKPMW